MRLVAAGAARSARERVEFQNIIAALADELMAEWAAVEADLFPFGNTSDQASRRWAAFEALLHLERLKQKVSSLGDIEIRDTVQALLKESAFIKESLKRLDQ
ncbi:MAG: hypothetical protein HGA90_03850 [Alphaproteobacteria bacterium]|nr:hypothetical protein [Alphaproteobacteria bacterium]